MLFTGSPALLPPRNCASTSGKNPSTGTMGSCSHVSILELVQGGWGPWTPCVRQRDGQHAGSLLLLSRLARTGGVIWAGRMFPAEILSTSQGWQRCTGSCGAAAVGLSYSCRPGEEANLDSGERQLQRIYPSGCHPSLFPWQREKHGTRYQHNQRWADVSLCPYFLLFHQSYPRTQG